MCELVTLREDFSKTLEAGGKAIGYIDQRILSNIGKTLA